MKNEDAYNEHQQIQDLRKMWSGFIMDWMKVGIPVGGALFGFFSYLPSKVPNFSWLPFLGWIIFVIPIITWRVMAHLIDRQIVEMYPRIIELEQQLEWDIHASYIYYNLRHKEPRKLLEDVIKKEVKVNDFTIKEINYRQYQQKSGGRDNAHKFLLKVWDKKGHQSVNSRGHTPQDWAVGLICMVTLAVAILLVFRFNAMT